MYGSVESSGENCPAGAEVTGRRSLVVTTASSDNHRRWFDAIEFWFHFCSWTFGCLYSIYQACRFTFDNARSLSTDDFEDGWIILGSVRRDVSDYEWAASTHLIYSAVGWNVLHVFLGLLVRHWRPAVPFAAYANISLSLACYVHLVGLAPALFLLAQMLAMYALQLFKSKWLCWLVNVAFLAFLVDATNSPLLHLLVGGATYQEYVFIVTVSWTVCRTLSFCMIGCGRRDSWTADQYSERHQPSGATTWHQALSLYMAYCLYLPLLYLGPLVMYDTFERDFIRRPTMALSARSLLRGLALVGRYLFWLLVLEVCTHYVHLSALVYAPQLLPSLSSWALCGLCFGMSQLFMVKYAVFYGLHGALARLHGIATPDPPKCIARIHLYSHMWKYFDKGLYNFLKCNIYIPIMGSRHRGIVSRLVGGAASFGFVCVWHGASRDIFIWSSLNYLGVVLETAVAALASTVPVATFLRQNVNVRLLRHLKALLAAPLLMMSAISNFYFICGGSVGDAVVQRIVINGWPFSALSVLAFLYSCCYMSAEVKLWECRRQEVTRDVLHYD